MSEWKTTSPFQRFLEATIAVEIIYLNVSSSGFLTVGKPDIESNFVYWDRKWCILEGSKFYIYNYPQEEEVGQSPEVIIDLQSAMEPFSQIWKCPRRKSFILKMKTRNNNTGTNFISFRHFDNFGSKRYLLAADSKQEFEKWTDDFNFVINSLEKWNKFVYAPFS